MTPVLQNHVMARLGQTGAADKLWGLLIVAALDGAAMLDLYLGNVAARPIVPATSARAASETVTTEPPGVYVSAITVEGFRGIGDAVTLTIPPGPGLVLVVGRNCDQTMKNLTAH